MNQLDPLSSAAPVASSLHSTPVHYLHVVGDVCPLCHQPITHDRANESAERLEAREREQFTAISTQLGKKFEAEKAAIKRESEAALESGGGGE
jgi:hypothetical protein